MRTCFALLFLVLLLVASAQAQGTNPFAIGGGGQGNANNGGGNNQNNQNNQGNANNAGNHQNNQNNGGANGGAGNAVGTTPVPTASPTSTAIPSSAAAGGITITQPQQTAAQSYYKIAQGVSVTFAWNFTSVLVYPTSLVVQAYCSDNSNTYTLASSLPGTATAFTWAPYDYDQSAAMLGQPQLIQATYRLQIMDERGLSVGALAGRFQPNTKVEFALYQPKPYIPISEGWRCAGCNGSGSLQPGSLVALVTAIFSAAAIAALALYDSV